jgi:hypothetical protein
MPRRDNQRVSKPAKLLVFICHFFVFLPRQRREYHLVIADMSLPGVGG